MPMTTVYIASMASANAASAASASRASKAHDAACTAMMDTYTSQGATLAARQTYAECVQRLNPPTLSDHTGDKAAVSVLLVGVIIGALIGSRAMRLEFGRFGGAFIGAFMGIFGTFVLGLIIAAILFVIS